VTPSKKGETKYSSRKKPFLKGTGQGRGEGLKKDATSMTGKKAKGGGLKRAGLYIYRNIKKKRERRGKRS